MHNLLVAVLSVANSVLKFLFQTLVCEHEIRNIHCACQDAEDLSHFAYITKDLETKGHYCHVFRVQTRVSVTIHCYASGFILSLFSFPSL